MNPLLGLIIGMVISLVIIPIMWRLAPWLRMLDKPDPRKVHRQAIPRVVGTSLWSQDAQKFGSLSAVLGMAMTAGLLLSSREPRLEWLIASFKEHPVLHALPLKSNPYCPLYPARHCLCNGNPCCLFADPATYAGHARADLFHGISCGGWLYYPFCGS